MEPRVKSVPVVVDPGPTDEDRIASAKDTLADIVADARTAVVAARTTANAVYAHPDATEAQKDLAIEYLLEADIFLAEIEDASAAANAANVTPELAESELAKARASHGDLEDAQMLVENIQIALQTPATPPPGQTVTDVGVLTNNSTLIQHVRANEAPLRRIAWTTWKPPGFS